VSCERAGELEGLTKSQNRLATEQDNNNIQTSYLSGDINNWAGELESLTKSQNRLSKEQDNNNIQTSYLSGDINNFLFFLKHSHYEKTS
jgi:hypothetical protein